MGQRSVTDPQIPSPLRIPVKSSDWQASSVAAQPKEPSAGLTSGSVSSSHMPSGPSSTTTTTPTTAGSQASKASYTSSIQPPLMPDATARGSEAAPSCSIVITDTRHVQSTPVIHGPSPPESPCLPEDQMGHNGPGPPEKDSRQTRMVEPTRPSRPDAIVLGDGKVTPAREGTFGRLEPVNVVTAHRVPSMTALLGHTDQLDPQPSPSSLYSESPSQVCPITDNVAKRSIC